MSDNKKKECEYCTKTRKIINSGNGIVGVSAVVISDNLWVSGWTGKKENCFSQPHKINYCPMCGKKLKEWLWADT